MEKQKVTLKADGTVPIGDLLVVVQAMTDVLSALTAESTKNPSAVVWIVDELRAGSATIVSRGVSNTYLGANAVSEVVDRYERLARQASRGHIEDFSEPVQSAVRKLAGLVNGHITSIALSAGDSPHQWSLNSDLSGKPDADDQTGKFNRYARSSVKGQVVTLDDKHALYFTLREAHTGRHVRCYPPEKYKQGLSTYWAKNRWVIVEGTYSRYSATPTLYAITDIQVLEDAPAGSWRDAIGCAPRNPNGSDMSSADAVRRVRDGDE